jgi:hypothetical protein
MVISIPEIPSPTNRVTQSISVDESSLEENTLLECHISPSLSLALHLSLSPSLMLNISFQTACMSVHNLLENMDVAIPKQLHSKK